MDRIARLAAVLAVCVALLVPACGGESSNGEQEESGSPVTAASSEGGTTLELVAPAGAALAFDKTALEAPAGTVTIVMTNESPLPHDIAIRGNGVDVKGETVGQGGESTVTAELAPGTYEFYCSVPGHEEGGMKGTLTVS